MSINQLQSDSVIAPTASLLSGGNAGHLMAVENSFPNGVILDT